MKSKNKSKERSRTLRHLRDSPQLQHGRESTFRSQAAARAEAPTEEQRDCHWIGPTQVKRLQSRDCDKEWNMLISISLCAPSFPAFCLPPANSLSQPACQSWSIFDRWSFSRPAAFLSSRDNYFSAEWISARENDESFLWKYSNFFYNKLSIWMKETARSRSSRFAKMKMNIPYININFSSGKIRLNFCTSCLAIFSFFFQRKPEICLWALPQKFFWERTPKNICYLSL